KSRKYMRSFTVLVVATFCLAAEVAMAPVVSEKVCPLERVKVQAKDGHETTMILRKPPGRGPFPAIVYLHGGRSTMPVESLEREMRGDNLERFLAAGWVVANPTFRDRHKDPQTRDALEDCK